jgi:Sugar-transfer associated ATP-grasp
MGMQTGTNRQRLELNLVDIPKPNRSEKVSAALSQVASGSTRSHLAMLNEYLTLRLGAGRLSKEEYLQLRLFDNDLYGGVDKRAFVGLKASAKLWLRANYRVDLFTLVNNKIASDMWCIGHGLPILPTLAVFHEHVGRPAKYLLRSEVELRTFLRNDANYPLFGKPVYGCQSLGSASIESYDPSSDSLIATATQLVPMDIFVAYVKAHAAAGYLFQPRMSPHAAVREICGNRLATVRMLTIIAHGKPEILRACWKIPSGAHAADNFLRPGNLLAQLDLETGRVVRVCRRVGTTYDEIIHHPDSGVRLPGVFVPNWHEVKQLAMDGAKLFESLPLIGWDIAPVDGGALIVEANVTPDFQLHQIADRRGMLDAAFKNFLRQRRKDVAEFRRAAKGKAVVEF